MTDFDYDCYKKKSIAHSAMKRKCGSKSKKCKLPSDNISQKQWNERCGEVVSYQIGKPMTWREFGKLPKDLKEEYLNNLISEYSANARNMADMFGVSVATVFRVVKNEELNVKFQKGRHPNGFEAEQFQRFLSGTLGCNEQESELCVSEDTKCGDEQCDISPDECDAQIKPEGTRLDSFTMNFSGEINIEMVANSLRYILGSGRKARLLISCEIDPA